MWTIVSSASERVLRARLECALLHTPAKVVTADSVLHGKPHPEPYQAAARILGLEPQECLVIEDAPSGVESGKAAGCKVLAVLSSHPVADLAEADWIIPSLEYVIATPTQDGAMAVRVTCISSESHLGENAPGS
jgi:sugar-phosphatase